MKADIKIGFFCNNLCRFCVQGDKRSKFGNKKFKEIKRELSDARLSCEDLVFTGGEPTLHQDFLDLVAYAKSLNFRLIQIQTNGRLFSYHDFCKSTINAGANEFSPALHGHSAELHDFLTSSRGSFNQTVKGILNLKKLGQLVCTNTVITKSNYRHLYEIANLLIKLNVDQFQFAFPHPLGSAAANFDSVVPRMTMIMPYLKRALDLARRLKKRVYTEAIPFCFLKGYEDCVAERILPKTKIYDANQIIDNFDSVRKKFGKKKSAFCKKCKCDAICEGPWKEYPEKFGWEEFVPIKYGIS